MARFPHPFEELERLQEEMNRLFGLKNRDDRPGLFDRPYSVPVDVLDSNDEVRIVCEVPGVEKKDLDVSVANQVLTIKGEKKSRGDQAKVLKDETWTGAFQRTLSLPRTVDSDKIKAELKDGILTVRIGKRSEAKPRQIPVSIK